MKNIIKTSLLVLCLSVFCTSFQNHVNDFETEKITVSEKDIDTNGKVKEETPILG